MWVFCFLFVSLTSRRSITCAVISDITWPDTCRWMDPHREFRYSEPRGRAVRRRMHSPGMSCIYHLQRWWIDGWMGLEHRHGSIKLSNTRTVIHKPSTEGRGACVCAGGAGNSVLWWRFIFFVPVVIYLHYNVKLPLNTDATTLASNRLPWGSIDQMYL